VSDERLAAARDPEEFRQLGHAIVDRLTGYLADAGARAIPVSRRLPPEGMADRWPADFGGGADPLQLVERILSESVVTHHPAYVGHQLAAPLPLAALATLVTAVTNGSGAIYELSQSSTACEAALAGYLAGRLGLPGTAGGMIVHGGTIATLTALLAARQAKAGFDVWRDGAHAGPPLALLASEQAHYSTARAAHIMGFGEAGAIAVETDERFQMRPAALTAEIAAARARGQRPIAVVATAGSTPTGAFDPLDAIADVCAAEGLWLHVDAAHGGSAALSPALAPQLAGIGRADSVVWDLHKTLPFPALASLLAYARARDAYGAFAQKADYLFRADDPGAENMGTRTLECTRPQLALVAYLGFAAVGADGLREHVERIWALGPELAGLVRASGDFELALEPESNIVCFRHIAPAGSDADAHQEHIRGEVNASGSFYLVQTRLRDATWLRCALMNAATTRDDLLALLAALRAAAARL
jgi:L-2,4-diaminobutyrate decarboxylase